MPIAAKEMPFCLCLSASTNIDRKGYEIWTDLHGSEIRNQNGQVLVDLVLSHGLKVARL